MVKKPKARSRIFNGKKYHHIETVKDKTLANKKMKQYHLIVFARKVKTKKGYDIFVRPTRNQIERERVRRRGI